MALIAGLLLMSQATLAWGQTSMPSAATERSSLVSYAIAVVATIAVIALSIMSAKRTHQD